MSLNFQVHCPYCKRPVAAPVAMVGQRIMCPNCRAEIVLNPTALLAPAGAGRRTENQADLQPPVSVVAPPVATTPPPVAAPSTAPPAARPLSQPAPPVRVPPAAVATASAAPPVTAPPPSRPNTAQFLAGAPQGPAITSTADGKLPTLQLADSPEAAAPRTEAQSPPAPLWLALLAVVGSTMISLLLVTHDFDGSQSSGTTKSEARRQLTAFYGDQLTPPRPFQVHLREAQLAHSRGDLAAERDRYRQVLALLRAEGRSKFDGLTGTPGGDTELARLLAILLAD